MSETPHEQTFGELLQTSDESKDTNHRLGADGAPGTCWLCVHHPHRGPCKRCCALVSPGDTAAQKGKGKDMPEVHSHWHGDDPRAWYLAQSSCSIYMYYNVTTINSVKKVSFLKKLMAQSAAPSEPMSI